MKIAYDVSAMAGLVAACQTANEELQKAQSLVQEVQSHSDWTCKEKDTIDNLMRECKKWIRGLCESQSGFLGAIRLVAEDLADAEKNIGNLFGGVEGLLGKILAIPVKTVTVVGGGLLGTLFGTGKNAGSTTHIGSSGVSHGGGGRADGHNVFENVKESVSNVADQVAEPLREIQEARKQEIYAKYNATFHADGQLVWPENEHPPMELLDAMGADVMISMDGGTTLIATWTNETGQKVSQKFVDPQKSVLHQVMEREERMDTLRRSVEQVKSALDIVSFQDMAL